MSAQNFLENALKPLRETLFGQDYPYDSPASKSKAQSGASKPNPYAAKPNSGNMSGQSRNVFDTWKDKIKSMPGSQPAKPNPYAAKPTGQLTGENAGSLLELGSMTVGGAVTAPLILGGSEDASRKWSRLGYSSPEAYQKAVSQNANRERPISSDNPLRPSQPEGEETVYAPRIERKPGPFDEGYVKPNTTMEPTEPAARNEYLNPAPDVAFVPDSTLNNGRDNSRTNANGVVQKGTDMGRSFNDLLSKTNTSGYQPFSSNQLQTTSGSPDATATPKTQQILAGIQAGKETDMSIEGYQPPASTQPSARDGVLGGIRGGARTDRGIQGTSTAADGVFAGIQGGQKTDQGIEGYKKSGSTSRLDAALNDKEGINSYMSKFSSGDRERAANRAFLDTKGSMEGLRAKEAVNGVVYAQQNHYIAGADPKGPAQKITRDEARSISSGDTNAQALLKSYTQGITESGAATPSSRQDPVTAAGSAVKSGIEAGAKTDFELNNSQGTPQASTGPTVPLDQIPKDLSGAAGKEYLKKLDSGTLFN